MQTYTVIYTDDDSIFWQFFLCEADDGDHAEEQCYNAYPECEVLWVNEGENYSMDEDVGAERGGMT